MEDSSACGRRWLAEQHTGGVAVRSELSSVFPAQQQLDHDSGLQAPGRPWLQLCGRQQANKQGTLLRVWQVAEVCWTIMSAMQAGR